MNEPSKAGRSFPADSTIEQAAEKAQLSWVLVFACWLISEGLIPRSLLRKVF